MDWRIQKRKALEDEVEAFILQSGDFGLEGGSSEDFNRLAMKVFEFQYSANPEYQAYCKKRRKTPEQVRNWKEIPAVPAEAFKETAVVCGPLEDAVQAFRTSGTTRGSTRRGTHYLFTTRLYDVSLLTHFKRALLPDRNKMLMGILTLLPERVPDSSLLYMLGKVKEVFGAEGSQFFLSERGFLLGEFLKWLEKVKKSGEPAFLLGTTMAFVHARDEMAKKEIRFRLPPGSRVMDTGGHKGKGRGVTRDEVLHLFDEYFGISPEYVVNEYGMTEMGTQYYDTYLEREERKGGKRIGGREKDEGKISHGKFRIPPWARVRILDPLSLEELPPGEMGVLQHLDLTNVGSAISLLTEDVGYMVANGFILSGRAKGSEARGCSISADEFLRQRRTSTELTQRQSAEALGDSRNPAKE